MREKELQKLAFDHSQLRYVARQLQELKEKNDIFIKENGWKPTDEFLIHCAKLIGAIDGITGSLENVDL